MKRFLFGATLGLVGLTACGQCPNQPYPGVCSSTTCDIRAKCQFNSDQTWYDDEGNAVAEFDAGQNFWPICGTKVDAHDTCETACVQLTLKHGAYGVDCSGVDVIFPHQQDGECSYYDLCDPGSYPLPSESGGSGGGGSSSGSGGSDPGPGFYCIPDPERAAEAAQALSELAILDDTYFDGYDWAADIAASPLAVRYVLSGNGGPFALQWSPGDSCGWWEDTDEISDQDAICQELCWSVLQAHEGVGEGDDSLVWSNCDLFIQNTMCMAGAMPGDGASFTWQTSAGTTRSPLTCDEACCDDIDVGACYNLNAGADVFHVADTTRSLTVPFELDANGVITTGALVGSIAYSAPVCGSGTVTCPFYLENLDLHLPAPITGAWRDQAGLLRKFSGLLMETDVVSPVMGGWRPSVGQFQLRPLSVPIHLTTHILTSGLPSTPVHQTTTNEKAVTGTIGASGSVTLSGSITLAPGIVLTLGATSQ